MKTLKQIDDRHYKLVSTPREFRGNQYVEVKAKTNSIPKWKLYAIGILLLGITIAKTMQVYDEAKPTKTIISPLPKSLTLIK